MISLEYLLCIPRVDPSNPFDLSDDGKTVAFSSNESGKWEIYLLDINFPGSPKPIKTGQGNFFKPKFSPVDSKYLICAVDYDGSESYHLLLCDLHTEYFWDITPGETLQPNFSWSPDGLQVAFISNRTGNFDVYLLDIPRIPLAQSFEKARHLGTIGHPVWAICWSPDGNWVACSVETIGSDYGIYLLPTQASNFITLCENGVPIQASEPAWSKDSSQLIFQSARNEYQNIAIYNHISKRIDWITDSDGDDVFPMWDNTGKYLVYVHNEGTKNSLVLRKDNGQRQNYRVGVGMHSYPRFTPDNQNVIVLFESPKQPPNLWLISLANGQAKPLTNFFLPELSLGDLSLPDEIQYPGTDGILIPALLYKPASKSINQKPSGVVISHGGPSWHYSMGWDPLISHMTSRGWIVLAPNYRGSSGYGRKWQNASYLDMGGVDSSDVAAGAIYLAETGMADSQSIAITGRSHGGFLAMSCLTRFPNLWVAGSGIVPFFDWQTSYQASREDLQHW